MLGQYMVHSQFVGFVSAVLASELVSPEYFLLSEFDGGAGTFDNMVQTDDGGLGIGSGHSANHPTAIHDHVGFTDNNQAHRPARGTDVEGGVIAIEDQNWFIHFSIAFGNYSMVFPPCSRVLWP